MSPQTRKQETLPTTSWDWVHQKTKSQTFSAQNIACDPLSITVYVQPKALERGEGLLSGPSDFLLLMRQARCDLLLQSAPVYAAVGDQPPHGPAVYLMKG